MGPRRHQIVARTLGRRLGEHRRLDVDEPVVIEIAADRTGQPVAQQQPLLHHVAAQVEIAVLQPHFLADFLVELERQRLGAVQHLDAVGEKLDLAGLQLGIGGTGRSRSDRAAHGQHVLAAGTLGFLEDIGAIRVEDDLQQAVSVAQVNENDAAMVAAAVDPAGDGHGLADQRFVDLTTVMRTHESDPLLVGVENAGGDRRLSGAWRGGRACARG